MAVAVFASGRPADEADEWQSQALAVPGPLTASLPGPATGPASAGCDAPIMRRASWWCRDGGARHYHCDYQWLTGPLTGGRGTPLEVIGGLFRIRLIYFYSCYLIKPTIQQYILGVLEG